MTSDASSFAGAAVAGPLPFSVQTCIAHDADEQARNLHGWRQTYDQLTAGRFVGTITELCLEHMQVFRETTSHSLRQTCEVQKDAYWFGIPVQRERDDDVAGRIDTQTIDDDALAFRPGGIEFELLTPAGYEILGVVVNGAVLRRYAADVERVGLDDHVPRTAVVPIGGARKAQLCASLQQILDADQLDDKNSRAPLSAFARNALQASILASLFDLGPWPSTDAAAMPTRRRRQWIVSEARGYVLKHRERPIGVPELCERLHVSRRTLQYCFHDVLGMAPATYLRALRLNGARRELGDAQQRARSVQDVAAAWGFWHLSQFATDYRKLFGMRPSDTLKAALGGRDDTQIPGVSAMFAH
ncbi:helix-turn-helix domain-containing protein [Paraburkholderia flava]|uniref:helix-turn-helix domain-containing protein n=1 Tax=Paraburkholderia flava TaxID=2547393 RepID=UPI00105B5514|nr:helix-turn-helix domain-containing protein [Paraburkholderia flava]